MVYNGPPYTYVKNLQHDIVAILDSNKNVVVRYAYDAWGRPIMKEGSLATTLGTVQPFRYRGYVYDEETELYYLRSRYCSPIIGRFVNADILTPSIWAITGSNFYAYCSNSPVAFFDPSGYGVDTVLDVISCACGLAELISNPSWEAAGSLLLDVGCAIAPFVPSPRGVKIAGDLLAAGDKVTDAKKTVVVAERALEYTDKAGDYNRYLEAIETAAQTLPSGSYRVYLSRYADNIPEYVGITKSWPNRSNYWKRRGRTVTTWIPSLDEASAHMVVHRLLGSKAIDAVGVALQGGQVIEIGRLIRMGGALNGFDGNSLAIAGCADLLGFLQRIDAPGLGIEATGKLHMVEGAGLEVGNGLLAPGDQRQRGRNDPADIQLGAIQQ